ncbi:hypothetical protein C8035_v008282 [Colletotrichum spinosum]|uniref:BZIP domain-containing protein n=1 Tax=Colletotrichum spinosum TaxID=1347390 RepID=A0A4R8QCW4_9PEZI|nr:hypothetical protein C8035_v008282 [Colletotrichum spinosum]
MTHKREHSLGEPAAIGGVDGVSASSKKQPKTQSFEGDGKAQEEKKKRLRGRPRLDTDDESAKDRRRTQIRLAQRAYRNRKESAIQELQEEVDELEKINQEMGKLFMQLWDFAYSKGMIESVPGFGRQLKEFREKFVALAYGVRRKPGRNGRLSASDGCESEDPDAAGPRGCAGKPSAEPVSHHDPGGPGQTLFSGFPISHEEQQCIHPALRSQAETAVYSTPYPTPWADDKHVHMSPSMISHAPYGYGIVNSMTTEEVDFQFGIPSEFGLGYPGQFDPTGHHSVENATSPYSQRNSYAYR